MLRRLPLTVALLFLASAVLAQQVQTYETAEETQAAIATAQAQAAAAKARGDALEGEARSANAEADQTRNAAAAMAARIQQSEAEMAEQAGRARQIEAARAALRAELTRQQRPLMQLTAALQRISRHSMLLAMLRPGTIRDAAHSRALLSSLLPEVQRRTAGLRAQILRSQALAMQARQAADRLKAQTAELSVKRQALAALETRQRLAARGVSDNANREAEQALALSEKAKDLTGLVGELAKAGELRDALARLPGPIFRPDQPASAAVQPEPAISAAATSLGAYMLPVTGRLAAGFGDSRSGQTQSRGIAIAALGGAQVVAPGAGRIAFAGPYRGYGNIVIVEHPGGWTSLITGLAQLTVRVGDGLRAGSPLGSAGPGKPLVNLELRRGGSPVNPMDYIKAE